MEGNYREENKEYRNLIRERDEGGARVKKNNCYVHLHFILSYHFTLLYFSPFIYGWMIKYFGN